MATISERTGSHYEAQEMPYGKAHVSYQECVMVEHHDWLEWRNIE